MRPCHLYPDGHCISCIYFEAYEEKYLTGKGVCRKNAPAPIHIARETLWPEVKINDWCGEYKNHE